jgi:hypothetical protein
VISKIIERLAFSLPCFACFFKKRTAVTMRFLEHLILLLFFCQLNLFSFQGLFPMHHRVPWKGIHAEVFKQIFCSSFDVLHACWTKCITVTIKKSEVALACVDLITEHSSQHQFLRVWNKFGAWVPIKTSLHALMPVLFSHLAYTNHKGPRSIPLKYSAGLHTNFDMIIRIFLYLAHGYFPTSIRKPKPRLIKARLDLYDLLFQGCKKKKRLRMGITWG